MQGAQPKVLLTVDNQRVSRFRKWAAENFEKIGPFYLAA